jgi:diguanylate cyclase (GGDEF)-like protein
MRTQPAQADLTRWSLAGAALLGLLWWAPPVAAPVLLGLAVAALARAAGRALLPLLPPRAGRALLPACIALGLASAAAWYLTPIAPALAVLALALLALASSQGRAAHTDRLTGLLAAAAFAERAEDELSRGLRFGRPATLAVIALDGLDALRDAHGRRAADGALVRAAEALRAHSRGYDLLARLRDGRFAILLPETTRDEAETVTGRMRAAIAALVVTPPGCDMPTPLAATVGLATHPWDGDTVQVLLDKAQERAIGACPPSPTIPAGPQPAVTGVAATPPRARDGQQLSRAVMAYIGLVSLSAIGLFVATFRPIPRDSWALLLTLAVVGITARQMRINLYGRGSVSHHFVALMAAAILLNPTASILLGMIVGVVIWPMRGKFHTYLFDAASNGLITGLLALGYPLLIAPLPDGGSTALALLVHGVALGSIGYILNAGTLVGVMAVSEGRNPLALWRERLAWFLPYTLVFGVLAMFMAWGGEAFGPLGLIFFAVPAAMMRLATKQYVDHTRENVTALQEAHARLTETNAKLSETVRALEDSYAATLSAFSGMLDARDSETEGHSQRVVAYAVAIGRAMALGADEVAALEVGALLHDVGKVGVSDAILRKNGPLTAEEWAEMRRHPEIGHELTSRIPFLDKASPLVRHHHERWDGQGYPDRLRGEDIPLGARIFAVVDSFDAMVSDRPYRKGLPFEVALAELQRGAGTQFDPQVVAAFLALVESPEWAGVSPVASGAVAAPARQLLRTA